MSKKFWLPTLQLAVSSVLASAVLGGWHLLSSEIQFHREVRERLTMIEKKLGVENTNEKETHVAISN